MATKMPDRWMGTMGQRWRNNYEIFEGMLTDVGAALIEHADLKAGEKVVEIGFGGGATSLEIANRIGADGTLVGVDISAELALLATERASEAGFANARFVNTDASTVSLPEAPFDVIMSRFGIMFFMEPYDAFRNLHGLVRPGGRAVFAVWAPAEGNEWLTNLRSVMGRYVDLPPIEPRTPGPQALSDFSYVEDLLGKAGFTAISKQEWNGPLYIGGQGAGPKAAAAFAMHAQSMAELVEVMPAESKAALESDLIEMLARYHDGSNVVMTGAVYLVTATA
jgi:ubiquinone/menaquinone biosynthesis C-methylase UbiE